MTVGEICTRTVVTAHPQETIVEAARRMRDRHVGDVVVVDWAARPVGILTDRDIVIGAVAQSPDELPALLVGDVMTREPVIACVTETLDEALQLMRTRGVRRLPVVSEEGRLQGVLSFDDILQVMSEELGDLISVMAKEQTREREVRS